MGPRCYFNTYVFMICVCTPIVFGTWFWASQSIDKWVEVRIAMRNAKKNK
jgi:hypothetical protein